MSAPLTGPIPADLDLPDGYVVTWAAVDPTTGADGPPIASPQKMSFIGKYRFVHRVSANSPP